MWQHVVLQNTKDYNNLLIVAVKSVIFVKFGKEIYAIYVQFKANLLEWNDEIQIKTFPNYATNLKWSIYKFGYYRSITGLLSTLHTKHSNSLATKG